MISERELDAVDSYSWELTGVKLLTRELTVAEVETLLISDTQNCTWTQAVERQKYLGQDIPTAWLDEFVGDKGASVTAVRMGTFSASDEGFRVGLTFSVSVRSFSFIQAARFDNLDDRERIAFELVCTLEEIVKSDLLRDWFRRHQLIFEEQDEGYWLVRPKWETGA